MHIEPVACVCAACRNNGCAHMRTGKGHDAVGAWKEGGLKVVVKWRGALLPTYLLYCLPGTY